MVDEQEEGRELTDEEVLERLEAAGGTAASPEERHNAHAFLHAVATSEDTLKTGYLKEEEVGIPKLSARTLKELALYSKQIGNEPEWSEFFDKSAEILTSTSLSKDAKLLELAVIQRREISNMSPQQPRKVNKRWFKKREPTPEM
jgi:hypothetical protein